jgi:hypothetical protein
MTMTTARVRTRQAICISLWIPRGDEQFQRQLLTLLRTLRSLPTPVATS